MKNFISILFIIIFLALFSSRFINYDDTIFFLGKKILHSNNFKDIAKTKLVFHGFEVTPKDGTHSLLPYIIFDFFNRTFKSNIFILHLINYFITSLIFFIFFLYLKHLKVSNPELFSLIFTISPAFFVYSNSFMFDNLYLFSFLLTLFFLKKFEDDGDKIYFFLFLFSSIFSILFSFINLFLIFFILFSSKKIDKKFLYIFFIFFLLSIYFIKLLDLGPDPLTSVRWFGSEKFLNYHKIFKKILSALIWYGLFFLPFFSKRELKNPILYLSLTISFIFFLLNGKGFLNTLLGTILLSSGLFTFYRISFEMPDDSQKNLFFLFTLTIIFLSPMIVGRYLYIGFLISYLLFLSYGNGPYILTSFIISILLSATLLYSELLHTNSYKRLNFEQTEKSFYFAGEWGYRFNAERFHSKPLKKNDILLPDSSIVYLSNLERMFEPEKIFLIHLKPIKSESLFSFMIKTISKIYGSGYYTDLYGILPFSFGKDFTVSHTSYLYDKNGNKNFIRYKEKIGMIGSDVVIICNLNDTIYPVDDGSKYLTLKFFEDLKVRKYSDGVLVKINKKDKKQDIILKKVNDTSPIKISLKDVEFISFEKNKNPNFDWFGISFQ